MSLPQGRLILLTGQKDYENQSGIAEYQEVCLGGQNGRRVRLEARAGEENMVPQSPQVCRRGTPGG